MANNVLVEREPLDQLATARPNSVDYALHVLEYWGYNPNTSLKDLNGIWEFALMNGDLIKEGFKPLSPSIRTALSNIINLDPESQRNYLYERRLLNRLNQLSLL